MCRTKFILVRLAEPQVILMFFVDLPARPMVGDEVSLAAVLPDETAAEEAYRYLMGVEAKIEHLSWSRDEKGFYLNATLEIPNKKGRTGLGRWGKAVGKIYRQQLKYGQNKVPAAG